MTDKPDERLERCACGGAAALYYPDPKSETRYAASVVCHHCGVSMQMADHDSDPARVIAAWNRRSAHAGVGVKALEWCDTIVSPNLRGGGHAYAGSVLGVYKVWGDGAWSDPHNFHETYPNWRAELLTLDAAKAAAQADYTARIRSALEPEKAE